MRVPLPEYSKLVASDAGEAVMSTPAWYHEHGDDSAVFVDAHRWPPQLVEHACRIAAATRLPDGQWVCVLRRAGEWRICWFADIRATSPARSEPPPVPADGEADEPIVRLHAFAGRLLAIAKDGALWLRDDAGWSVHQSLRGDSIDSLRNTTIDGKPALEWDAEVYDAQLEPLDIGDCADLIAVGGRQLAVHDGRLVDYARDEPVPVLPDHDVTGIEPGPGHSVLVSFSRVDPRGTHYDNGLFDAHANTVTMLPEDKVGQFPEIVTFTDAHDIVLFDEDGVDDEDRCALWRYSAAEIAALPHVPIAQLAVPPRHRLEMFDAIGAASRPIVATSGNAIAIALGTTLRFHTVDAPLAVHEIGHPVVAIASTGARFGALDTNGVLHTFDRDGSWLASRPAVERPRSLATSGATWIAIGEARIAMIEGERTQTLELAGGLAAAVDPDGGEILFACEGRRLVYWTRGELRDLPPPVEQIVALAPLGKRQFACAGENELYELDLAQGELMRINRQLLRPFVATYPDKSYLAAVLDSGAVEVGGWTGGGIVAALPTSDVRYSGYLTPADTDVTVHGLAFMDDGRLVIALDEGRGNIFDRETGAALKLDPQPGDPPSRWMFFCGGKLLIAE